MTVPANIQRDRDNKRIWVQSIKMERGCMDCGYAGHPAALEFDHRPGEIKLFSIGTRTPTMGRVRLLAEIEKCDVVCANCHRVRSATRGWTNQLERKPA